MRAFLFCWCVLQTMRNGAGEKGPLIWWQISATLLKGIVGISCVTILPIQVRSQSSHTAVSNSWVSTSLLLHINVTDPSFVGGNVWPSLSSFRQDVLQVCYSAHRAGSLSYSYPQQILNKWEVGVVFLWLSPKLNLVRGVMNCSFFVHLQRWTPSLFTCCSLHFQKVNFCEI